ncbi:Na+/H+ antiporter NhaA [Kineococcus sp. SYSU DK004]|uniref:Na+/H+ antiporter NhaA n=1 Tax=Kineococcus sp. SYSU DK004 TaxID=3383125 RepID=UPI003D7D9B5C
MTQRLARALRLEPVSGALLLLAALAALLWANLDAAGYEGVRELEVGAGPLRLTLEQWASDGLLAVFFFVTGIELKGEFVEGDLRHPRRAVLPIAAAVGGMAVPALLYVLVNLLLPGGPPGALAGWATPVATDIAFALAVLAVVGRGLPAALRLFLLTLAVVDDLLGITVIAVFYTQTLHLSYLVLALVVLAVFTVLLHRGVRTGWVLLPLGLLTWGLVHESGVHATVAGVLLGLAVPVADGTAAAFEHRWRPVSTALALPLFALASAGVLVGGVSGLVEALRDPVVIGIVVGLVLGKPIGVFGTTWLLARFTGAHLADELRWSDVFGLSLLAGMGFTVSLLIGTLSFGQGTPQGEHMTLGVLLGSLVAAVLASAVLVRRARPPPGGRGGPIAVTSWAMSGHPVHVGTNGYSSTWGAVLSGTAPSRA